MSLRASSGWPIACSGERYSGRPEHHAHRAQALRVRVRLEELGDAEVEQPRLLAAWARGEHHVLRLEVAVDDALVVDGGQTLGQLQHHPASALRGERAAPQVLEERLALGELHHQAGRVLRTVPKSMTRTTAGCSTLESRRASRRKRSLMPGCWPTSRRSTFSAHPAPQADLLCQVHLAHAATPEVTQHAKAFAQDE